MDERISCKAGCAGRRRDAVLSDSMHGLVLFMSLDYSVIIHCHMCVHMRIVRPRAWSLSAAAGLMLNSVTYAFIRGGRWEVWLLCCQVISQAHTTNTIALQPLCFSRDLTTGHG
jgi:hypothetical protein